MLHATTVSSTLLAFASDSTKFFNLHYLVRVEGCIKNGSFGAVYANRHNNLIEERDTPLQDVHVAPGDGVKRPWKNGFFHG